MDVNTTIGLENKLFHVTDQSGNTLLYFSNVNSSKEKEDVERRIKQAFEKWDGAEDEVLEEQGIFRIIAENDIIL